MSKKFVAAALVALSGALVLGHDMWLESQSFFVQPGETITVRNGNGTIYQKSENAVSPDRIATLTAAGPENEPVQTGNPQVNGHWLEFDFQPEKEGNYWIGLASKPRMISLSGKDFNGYLEHDGIPQVLEQRKKDGISDRDETERYSKYVKIYLQSGDQRSSNHQHPLGLDIEIVPLLNPYDLTVGAKLPVRVLLEGKPLSGLTLHAGYEGETDKSASHTTNQAGEASITLSAAGKWYIRGIHLTRVDREDHSYESKWATLTVEVAESEG